MNVKRKLKFYYNGFILRLAFNILFVVQYQSWEYETVMRLGAYLFDRSYLNDFLFYYSEMLIMIIRFVYCDLTKKLINVGPIFILAVASCYVYCIRHYWNVCVYRHTLYSIYECCTFFFFLFTFFSALQNMLLNRKTNLRI